MEYPAMSRLCARIKNAGINSLTTEEYADIAKKYRKVEYLPERYRRIFEIGILYLKIDKKDSRYSDAF